MDANAIQVGIRIRPLNQKEASLGEFWLYDDTRISQTSMNGKANPNSTYTFGTPQLPSSSHFQTKFLNPSVPLNKFITIWLKTLSFPLWTVLTVN
jgi:hypothetical protein